MLEDKHFGLALLPLEEIKTLLFYSGVRNLHAWAESCEIISTEYFQFTVTCAVMLYADNTL